MRRETSLGPARSAITASLLVAVCATLARAAPQVEVLHAPPPLAPPTLVQGVPGSFRLDGPATLDLVKRVELRNRLSTSAARVCPNVVQLSIERRVGDGVVFAIEASGLVLDRAGHVVTIGSSLEQAGRVAVHFQGMSKLRPRRARVVGVDDATDVGVLWIGPVELPSLELATAPPAPPDPVAAGADGRYVVTLFGDSEDAAGPLALGWMQEPLKNPMLGRRRFEQLLRVSLVRTPQSAGGVIASQDGTVTGLLLAPPASESGAPSPMLALPAFALRQGFDAVMVAGRAAEPQPEAATDGSVERVSAPALGSGGEARAGRAWLGFGARDLVEPEFLAQIGLESAIVVTDVFEASPALAASIEPHDLVLAWNGEPIASVEQLTERIASASPGAIVELDCLQRLVRRKIPVTLGAW